MEEEKFRVGAGEAVEDESVGVREEEGGLADPVAPLLGRVLVLLPSVTTPFAGVFETLVLLSLSVGPREV